MKKMNYNEATEYVRSLSTRGIVPGLENMRRLCEEIGNPQDRVKTVHIAGTNGKGSVGAYIGKMLECEGHRTGRYVSPAVENVREEFLINGRPISEEDYAHCISIVRSAAEKIENEGFFPTPFEVETAAAFVFFDMKKCDFALIECGMGGRLDATNVLKAPVCCVITKISEDHTSFLGGTLAEIAAEKAGIIKNGSTVAVFPQCDEVSTVLEKTCRDVGAEFEFAKNAKIITSGLDGTEFDYDGEVYGTSIAGLYQAQNAALAICAAKLMKISAKSIREGVKQAKWAYRFEIIKDNPYVILDGAHNPDGAEELVKTVKRYFKKEDVTFVFGVFKDKNYDKIAEITATAASKIYTVTPPSPRGLKAEILAETVKKYNSDVTVSDVETALSNADTRAVICFGSLSFLKSARETALMKKYQRIYNHKLYKELLYNIEHSEKNREFCLHGTEHTLDTARIAYIISLEEKLPYNREIIYAAALLHDIGRYNSNKEHHRASADLARSIMVDCGYDRKETEIVAEAIENHRKDGNTGLSEVLYRADKLSRNCFNCKAYDKCYWSEERKNRLVEY